MRRALTCALAFASLSGGAAIAEEISIRAHYPEGPLIHSGAVHFAEMHKDRVVTVTNDDQRTLYEDNGCGPTALAPYQDGFIVLCHLTNELHQLSATGALVRKFTRDEEGLAFENPNDASADDKGGVYFSASGDFSLTAPHDGALLYLDSKGKITRLASGLHYANGVYFDAAQQAVYLSEHLEQRILRFPVFSPGEAGPSEVFAELAVESLGKTIRYDRAGPDGLETDDAGNLFVAYYGAALVLALAPDGDILARIDVPEQLTTNVALSADERTLFITGSKRSQRKPFPGKMREIENPLTTQ
ncbi:SMP-30/gluconolactonase/LRE family protein [Hyphococcus flavus]|uniref:SMP-30/gluconolactonase/LRE family protein n=1 Tax=Hyphococcus flavus TaxID=1866326 RepID=A0AAE9ZE63_9PROT|nr:SMP-30/gluconolactonase/LRE family protein [Hyphococcus flavus]WDI32956.1 SMP-30/gluconolactonase/LRE family protein [Hyphococcus flavus]